MSNLGWKVARVFAFVMHYSGGLWLFERLDRGLRPVPRCTVIFYHRIASEPVGYHDVEVSPETFRDHVGYLRRRGYDFLSLEQYGEYLAGGRELACDSIVMTFDDGYRDNYSAAFPVLRNAGIPAAVFLCVGPMEGGPMLWWDRLARAVRTLRSTHSRTPVDDTTLAPDVTELLARAVLGSDAQASAAIGTLIDTAKALEVCEREEFIGALERACGCAAGVEDLMLTWDMVREMEAGGITFGAHSMTHPVFSGLSEDDARAELAESKRIIEERLGHSVAAFAYPYGKDGYFSDDTVAAVRQAGFRWAYTTENGSSPPGSDPYTLRRNGMRDVPTYMLAARLSGVFEHPFFAGVRRTIERRR